MARRVSSPTFVGRSEELAVLRAGLDRAPSAFLLGGEPGVGKSRLLAEFAAEATASGVRTVTGHCVDLSDGHIPLLPVREALQDLADVPEVLALAASPHGVFELVVGLLRGSAPLLLIIEDVHWADRSTLDFLAFLFRAAHRDPVVTAVSYRTDEMRDGRQAWLAEAARVADRIDLCGLGRPEVDALLASILGGPPAPGLAERIFARSDGNAFIAEELLAAGDTGAVPQTVRDTLLVRLAGLTDGARAAVGVAAVSGGRVHHRLLAQVSALPEDAVREAVDRHVLVAEGERLSFRHALLREVAYGELLPGERARMHAAFAQALEDRPLAGGSPVTIAAEIAHHWRQAGDPAMALPAAVRAGLEAERVHAPTEALAQFEHALALWGLAPEPGLDRADVTARAAAAAEASGRIERALELIDDAIALARDPVHAGLLHERRGWYLNRAGHAAAALEALDAALRLVPIDPPSATRARVLNASGYLLSREFRWADAVSRCEQALAIAREIGDEAEEGVALLVLGGVATGFGDYEQGVVRIGQALDIARRLERPVDVARAAINLSDALIYVGRLEEAFSVAVDGAEACRRWGLEASYGGIATCNATMALLRLGRWAEADALTREALRRCSTGLGAASLHQTRGELEVWRGNLAAAAEHQRAMVLAVPGDLPSDWRWELAITVAEREFWGGDPGAAGEALAGALEEVSRDGDPIFIGRISFIAVQVLAAQAELARAHRDAAAAQRAVGRACELHSSLAAAVAGRPQLELRAHLALTTAELGRAAAESDAVAWSAAATACDDWANPFRSAYARWRQAEALLSARAPRAEAAEALRKAHAVATRLGARLLREEIEALARRARIDLAAPAPTPEPEPDPFALTKREREVLEHLAEGETNRQIAEALFISVKTAGVHVSSILRKLDASTRGEAAAIAHRARARR